MSILVSLLIWGALAICLICAAMANRCYDVMLDQVNRRLPEGQKIKRPFFSHKWSAIVSLHEQFYPESRVRAKHRLLIRLLFMTFAITGFIMLAWVISRGPVHR
jgi:4-hydroxybenzoate polyprenyltransferase